MKAKSRNLAIKKLSGTKFRQMLRSGQDIPEWFAFKSVVSVSDTHTHTHTHTHSPVDMSVHNFWAMYMTACVVCVCVCVCPQVLRDYVQSPERYEQQQA